MATASDDPVENGHVRIPLGGTATPVARAPRHTRSGTFGVAAVLVAAGLLFTTSAHTSHGTQLRSQRADLAGLVEAENERVQESSQRVAELNEEVRADSAQAATADRTIRDLEDGSADVEAAAGLVAVTGPALTITLDDAPRDSSVPAQAGPNDLVVHQQDVQAVVNALWAGGAEAMMLMDQRVISTSAVRCVGNTLILQGRVYSPPYKISAIGDIDKMRAAVDLSPQIDIYLQYVASLRLGWKVESSTGVNFPAYAGSLSLSHARVAGSATPTTPSRATTTDQTETDQES
ncbi:DUF881 domain-containing protein [Kineosporia succinea]|uniref:Uncharacterized protein YlxW (UPF0749 family) n=1 Tax=Kineosporia succinea TaxID=84632 RepID=A0ABT9P251_9ACTN|nr:DUF881 domain-containing protein [Kineosporia succinea]MDP9826305.1 uncharacterized protein YlxW (UPF0749 family) [Kineosporia succinea]